VAQIPLNPEGGTSARLSNRITNDADERLDELACRTGMRRPDLVRRVLMLGIERAERALADPEPPERAA
jgi:predicted DNA-binding protein